MFGISVYWLALSLLFDGFTTLVLPKQLVGLVGEGQRASVLGVATVVGLLAAMLVQPVAGALSDRLRPRWGRRGGVLLGTLLILPALAIFGLGQHLLVVIAGYVAVQVAASVAQAAQQGFIPDLVAPGWRGTAAGLRSCLDLGGALLGFLILGQLLGAGRMGAALLAVAGVAIAACVLTLVLVRELPAADAPVSAAGWTDTFRLNLRQHRAFGWLVLSRFLFLLGVYGVGRFFLYFVADRLGLEAGQAAREAGGLLAALTLLTAVGAPLAGRAADHFGRLPLMLVGAVLSAAGTLLLAWAASAGQILAFGGLMALGSAAYASANWALAADLAPPGEAARFLALANFGTAGAAATAGLFGLLVDGANRLAPGAGYPALFAAATVAFLASAVPLRAMDAASRVRHPSALEAR